ncbi:hypothetical protein V6N13_097545 [Hibiscus sabdariffa]
MVKKDGICILSPKNKSSHIPSMSKEDTSSTKGKSKIINDSDNLRSPGQEKRDREALSDSPLLENTDYHSDSCQKDIIINDKPEQDGLIGVDDIITIDSHLCNSLKQIKINCDALFEKSRKFVGIASVARSSYGVIVDGINAQALASSTLVAECLALRLGSYLIERQGW